MFLVKNSEIPTYNLKTVEAVANRMNVLKITEPRVWGFVFTVENGSIIGKKDKSSLNRTDVTMPSVSAFSERKLPSVSSFYVKEDVKVDYVSIIASLARKSISWVIKHRKSAM